MSVQKPLDIRKIGDRNLRSAVEKLRELKTEQDWKDRVPHLFKNQLFVAALSIASRLKQAQRNQMARGMIIETKKNEGYDEAAGGSNPYLTAIFFLSDSELNVALGAAGKKLH